MDFAIIFQVILVLVILTGFIFLSKKFDLVNDRFKEESSILQREILTLKSFCIEEHDSSEELTELNLKLSNILTHNKTLSDQVHSFQSLRNNHESIISQLESRQVDIQSSLSYKINEVTHLKEIIQALQKKLSLLNKKVVPVQGNKKYVVGSAWHSGEELESEDYSEDDNLVSYSGERDGLMYQDEALAEYEGESWSVGEFSAEMGHDGDDY